MNVGDLVTYEVAYHLKHLNAVGLITKIENRICHVFWNDIGRRREWVKDLELL